MILLLTLSFLAATSSDLENSDIIRERALRAVKHERIQRELEFGDFKQDVEKSSHDREREWIPPAERRSGEGLSPGALSGIGELGQALKIVGIAAVVFLVVLIVYRIVQQRSMATASATDSSAAIRQRDNESPDADRTPADELAAQGRWAEAIHALLLAAIATLSAELGRQKSSQTSRELLQLFRLDDSRRNALRQLTLAVEQAIFGGREADSSKFAQCRDHFRTIVGAST